jgi:hypothetical protein
MAADSNAIIFPLTQKFEAFYELFTEFANDALELHSTLAVNNDASRAAFSSLSRIMALSDQLSMVVSLMREDVRVIDELTANPVNETWTDQIEHCFYDWLKASRSGAHNVN